MSFNNDVTIRKISAEAAREIKASLHYAYIVNGITLDGTEFTAGELLLEGTCLVRDDVTGKYAKYADASATKGHVTGLGDVTQADASGVDDGTSVTFTVNGVDFVLSAAVLQSIALATTDGELIAIIEAAEHISGDLLGDVADVAITIDKLSVTTKNAGDGELITAAGVWGVAGDEATIEGILGIALPAAGVEGTGTFPTGKSNPVILDEAIRFVITDEGTNPDITAGQVIVHGSVYKAMLIGSTDQFEAAINGFIRLV